MCLARMGASWRDTAARIRSLENFAAQHAARLTLRVESIVETGVKMGAEHLVSYLSACQHVSCGGASEGRVKWRAQVAQLERQLAASKEAMEADIRAKAVEADALKGVVDELRNATCHTIAGSEAAILALQVRHPVPHILCLGLPSCSSQQLILSRVCKRLTISRPSTPVNTTAHLI